jgi:hypothetical protein
VIVIKGPVKDDRPGVLIMIVAVGEGSLLAGLIVVTETEIPVYACVIVTTGPVKLDGAGVFIITVAVGEGSLLPGLTVVTEIEVPV